jgi:hypothetical protein
VQPINGVQNLPAERGAAEIPPWMAALKAQVAGLRFGVVQLTVHEGQVVQIERTEKIRFTPEADRNRSSSPSVIR